MQSEAMSLPPSASTPTTPRCRSSPRARPEPAGSDRGGEHPEQHLVGYAGLMQADAYADFGKAL